VGEEEGEGGGGEEGGRKAKYNEDINVGLRFTKLFTAVMSSVP
jgi:hypothetical protein